MPHAQMTSNNRNVVGMNGRQRETRKQVLERLFKEHEAAVCAFIRGRIGVAHEPEDIVQEVFLRLAGIDDLVDKMQQSRGSCRAYIFTMANNLVVDLERRNARLRNYETSQRESGEALVEHITPEVAIAAYRDLELVKRVIMDLRPSWRRAFVLSRFKFLSYPQIAERMGVTVKQVENFMTQALSRIRAAERAIKAEGKGR